MAGIMLKSNKELAITLLRDNPSVFVRFIAMYLLAFVAPRFKKDEFIEEEETRIIISSPKKEYNNLLDNAQCPAVIIIRKTKRRTEINRSGPKLKRNVTRRKTKRTSGYAFLIGRPTLFSLQNRPGFAGVRADARRSPLHHSNYI